MPDHPPTPSKSFEERMEALTMNLELTGLTLEHTNKVVAAIGSVFESHDRQIERLIELARPQNDRISRLESR